jgi:maltooligosyltrehalose synthase
MKRKRTPDEWKAERARMEADLAHLRELMARRREKLEAWRRAEAEKSRGLRRFFSF